ncbi:MAG TPA: hypothetical protein VGS06_46465 [Streptosporangiaceae bacterium]|nr:hypothetical protein [Streptosporangiaceae bacterium]
MHCVTDRLRTDHLDIFAVGTDHGIYTAAWEPDFTDGWHGWWRINGGVATWGLG